MWENADKHSHSAEAEKDLLVKLAKQEGYFTKQHTARDEAARTTFLISRIYFCDLV